MVLVEFAATIKARPEQKPDYNTGLFLCQSFQI